MPIWGQVVGLLSVIVTIILSIVGAVYKLTHTIDRAKHEINGRTERLEVRIAALEGQTRAFLQVFPKIITTLIKEKVVTVDVGMSLVTEALGQTSIAEIFEGIKPTINPLSQIDIDTLRSYVERLKAGQSLTTIEAQDFYRITDIITREYPANQNSWLLFLIAGFLLAALLSKKG